MITPIFLVLTRLIRSAWTAALTLACIATCLECAAQLNAFS